VENSKKANATKDKINLQITFKVCGGCKRSPLFFPAKKFSLPLI
jgi:hypothetical protein